MVLGAFIQGFEVQGRVFAGGSFDFLTPFSVLTGVALVFGYGLLGAGWLVLKTEGRAPGLGAPPGPLVLHRCRRCDRHRQSVDALLSGHRGRWFSWPNMLFLSPVPIVTALVAWAEWRSLNNDSEYRPLSAPSASSCSPTRHRDQPLAHHRAASIHLWEAASSGHQAFLLVGTLFLMPIILMYTGWSYWVFRGKVRADIGYH